MPTYDEMEREYFEGLDLLRLLAMFLVVVLHVLLQGGVLKNAEGAARVTAWVLETLAFCAVNIYALTTGFLSYSDEERPFNFSRLIALWLQVLFYSVLLTLPFYAFHADDWSLRTLLRAFFPATTGMYWYFSAFVGVVLVAPLLNYVIRTLSDAALVAVSLVAVILFCLWGALTSHFADPLGLYYGYSFLWLSVLYFFGAVIRRLRLYRLFSQAKCAACFLVCWLVLLAYQLLLERFAGNGRELLRAHDGFYFSYLSPAVVGMAVFALFFFIQMQPGHRASVLCNYFAPSAFGVYLIHAHPMVLHYIVNDRFRLVAGYVFPLLFLAVLLIAVMIFVICLLLDTGRDVLFARLGVPALSKAAELRLRAQLARFLRA